MGMEEFVKRHNEWSHTRDKEELLSEILTCLQQTKKNLTVNVKGKAIYTDIEPEHLIEDLIARFLSLQWKEYYVVVESSRGTFVAGENVAGVVRMKMDVKDVVNKLSMKN